jgi:hypothetical protein
MLDARHYYGAKEIFMKINRMILNSLLFVFFLTNNVQAETKNFTDKELDYDVITEVSYIGIDIPNEELVKYSAELYNWCKTLDKNSKKVEKLTKEKNWGLAKAISDYEIKKGETYVIRLFSGVKDANQFQWITLILLTVKSNTSNTSDKYIIHDIYESYVDISQKESDSTDNAELRYYADSILGFSGHASAKLVGANLNQKDMDTLVTSSFNFANSNNFKAKILDELTEEQVWLLGKSLIERSLKKGETYTVAIIPEPKSSPTYFKTLIVIVTIRDVDQQNDSFSYSYTAIESAKLSD